MVQHALMARDEQYYLLSSDAGYGFVCQFKDLVSRNKNGKAILTLPTGAKVMPPVEVKDTAQAQVIVVSNEGRMLVFPIADLPQLAKGKGNKMISIPTSRHQTIGKTTSDFIGNSPVTPYQPRHRLALT